MAYREISLDSGDIHLTIKETGENLDFNPHDMNFIQRFSDLLIEVEQEEKTFNAKHDIIKKMPNKSKSEKQARTQAEISLMNRFCDFCEEKINSVFGEDACVKIFGGQRVWLKYPLFLQRIAPLIEESRDELMAEYEKM